MPKLTLAKTGFQFAFKSKFSGSLKDRRFMFNIGRVKKINVRTDLKKTRANALMLWIFIIMAVLPAAIPTSDAAQVTLLPNSTGSYGFNGTLESDGTSISGGPKADFKTSTALPANALDILSSLDTSASINSRSGSGTDDEYINITFVINGVQSCNWIVGNFQGYGSGTNDVPHLGIVNATGGYESKATATTGLPYRNLTFNQTSNLASYCIISGNTASITLVGWGRGTSTGTITASYFNVTVDYVPYVPPPTYMPPAPANLGYNTSNFWVNYTWEAGTGNVTDGYNVNHNGSWTNGTIIFLNNSVGAHGWSNISVYAYNNSGGGTLNSTPATLETQVANNEPVQAPIGNKEVTAGDLLTFTVSATDADSDQITYGTNATLGTLAPDGVYSWTPGGADVGTYFWSFNSSDNYGGVASENITVTVNPVPIFMPPTPANLSYNKGNFFVNYSWEAGAGNITDWFNVSVNGTWIYGTTETFYHFVVGPHGWSNISVYAYNGSGGGSLNSTPAALDVQVDNNVPYMEPIGNKAVTAGNLLSFTVIAYDLDSDQITYGTNATGGTLNYSTGIYSWMPSSADAGEYFWSFSSNDGWDGIEMRTTTITVTATSGTYINGTVRSGGSGVEGVTVSTNTTVSTTTDASGFYSLPVTAGSYELTASLEPEYYTNSSVTASLDSGVVVRDIELLIKPTGTISGSVTNV